MVSQIFLLFQIIAEEEPESPPLNYELDMAAALAASATSEVHQLTSCQTGSASVSADLSSNNAKSPTNDLESQERRTRIALLENQQAELETEIRLLKQCGKSLIWVMVHTMVHSVSNMARSHFLNILILISSNFLPHFYDFQKSHKIGSFRCLLSILSIL